MSELVVRLGERIRNMRKEKGLSQEQLGELAGLHTNYIGQVDWVYLWRNFFIFLTQ